jgi:hypothetical protein
MTTGPYAKAFHPDNNTEECPAGAGPVANELLSLRLRSNKLAVHLALSVFRVLQRLVRSYLGMGALDRLSRYIYDGAYGLPQWREISTFNYGYAPCDGSVVELWPNEPHQIQLYAEVAKAVGVVAGTAPSRLLEVCCGRGGGLTYLHAKLSPAEITTFRTSRTAGV